MTKAKWTPALAAAVKNSKIAHKKTGKKQEDLCNMTTHYTLSGKKLRKR